MDMSGSYRSGAFAWGGATGLYLVDAQGLDGLPAPRSTDVDRPLSDGAWSARTRRSGRELQWGFRIRVASAASFDALVKSINGAARQPTDTELATYPKGFPLLFDGGTKLVYAWLRETDIPRQAPNLQQVADCSLRWFCPDPLKYSATLHSAFTGLGTATGGLVFPATFPATFGSGSAGGQVQVTNSGNTDTPPTFLITGPVDNPIIDHVELGRSLQFSLSLGSSDTLTLDADTRTAVLNSAANREQALTLPQWFFLTPGVNTIRYRNNGAFVSSTLFVFYRDADL